MRPLKLLSAVDQLVAHLRKEIAEGSLKDTVPGVPALAAELGLSPKTAAAALRILVQEGLISHEGAGKKRRIAMSENKKTGRAKRISILLSEPEDMGLAYLVDIFHQLTEAGFEVEYASKTLTGLGMNSRRVAEFIKKTKADAWLTLAATHAVLESFCVQKIPVFAIFGSFSELPIAGCYLNKLPVMESIVRDLTKLGHSRIVLINRTRRRLPAPGKFERVFLDELEKLGIKTSAYNMPDWKESPEGLDQCLESLFRITPPTAIIFDEPVFFTAAMRFLAKRNLRVPEDVSIICNDDDPSFKWYHPPISHITWDPRTIARRIKRWAANIDRGVNDIGQTKLRTKFVSGSSIGPAAQ